LTPTQNSSITTPGGNTTCTAASASVITALNHLTTMLQWQTTPTVIKVGCTVAAGTV